MTPVDQDIFEDGRGNCFAACIASLLDLPLSDVPNFSEHENCDAAAENWLNDRGLTLFVMKFLDTESLASVYFPGPYRECVVAGPSPRPAANGRRKGHAVVGRTNGYGIALLHDPHPSREFIADGYRWLYFVLRGFGARSL